MAFNETAISDKLAYGFEAITSTNTRIVTYDNGNESRNVNWTKAKRRYRGRYQTFTPQDFAELLAVFIASDGPGNGFLFKDFTDYSVTAQALGIAPAGSTPVQLVKTYGLGAVTKTRTIKKPRALGFVLYQNGTPKAGTLDTTTGIFTPTTAWTGGAVLTWTGQFYVPVRFASDDFAVNYVQFKAIETDVELVEIFRAE